MPQRQPADFQGFFALMLPLLLAGSMVSEASGQGLILRLKNGDRISGAIVSADDSWIVLSNQWSPEIAVPTDEVVHREVIARRDWGGTNAMAVVEPMEQPIEGKLRPPPWYWKGEARVGLDYLYGARQRQVYHARLRLAYERPYEEAPTLFFRNTFDYSVEYGRTRDDNSSEVSANRMLATDKFGWDFSRRWYVYSIAGGGYDEVRKIDLQYQAGPGLGYHVFNQTNFVLNLEAGIDYQAQYRTDSDDVQDFFYRLGQELTWRVNSRMSLNEKIEIFPRVNIDEFRIRFETTLSYDLWRNLALNLSIVDMFDTRPATGVNENELQVRSSLGLKF